MALTFDHVFICSENPDAAVRALTDFGRPTLPLVLRW